MKQRLSFKPAFSATVITLIVFACILALIGFVLFLLIKEAANLYFNNVSFFKSIFSGYNLLDVLRGLTMSDKMVSAISNTAVSALKIIPITITLIVISFVFTVFLINNLSKLVADLYNRVSDKNEQVLRNVIGNFKVVSKKFLKSYFVLYFITFVESLLIFWFIKLDYPLVFAFLTAVADIMPILGPGTIYLPIAVIKYLYGDIFSAVTLIVFWLVVVILRQVIEPKILSDSIKIHPLVVLSALYFSIASSNIWVLFYIILFVIVYKILVDSGVLTPVFSSQNNKESKDC